MSKRLLAFDPGAERLGWAAMVRESEEAENKPPELLGVGFSSLPRMVNESKLEYQDYRLEVLYWFEDKAQQLISSYEPDEIVSEIVPPVGGGNFVVATQSQLALCAITAIQVVAIQHGIPVHQVGATTVKTRIGGNKKATKVKVRNGAMKMMPDLELHKFTKKDLMKVYDVSDAAAIGLTHWGFDGRS